MFKPQVLLHPTDYSDCAAFAFEVAVDLARHHHARLLVLHVANTLGAEGVSVGEAINKRQPADHVNHLRQRLHQAVPAIQDLDIEYLLGEGDPGKAIAEAAQEQHCDLIVMGTYGRSALSRLLAGSVTQRVVGLAPCAILTVRMPLAR